MLAYSGKLGNMLYMFVLFCFIILNLQNLSVQLIFKNAVLLVCTL